MDTHGLLIDHYYVDFSRFSVPLSVCIYFNSYLYFLTLKLFNKNTIEFIYYNYRSR